MSEDRISTIGDFADGGYSLNVWCDRCQRGGVIGMEPFIAKLGRDHPARFHGHIVCSKCGNKDIELRLQPSSTPM